MPMSSIAVLLLGLLAAAGLLLFGGGVGLIRRGGRHKGWLMIAAGIVMLGNVLIWVV